MNAALTKHAVDVLEADDARADPMAPARMRRSIHACCEP